MKILCTIVILLIANSHLFATWSIIIIDQQTKEIGIAGASCTHNCYGIGEILPGVGAIIVQAMSNNDALPSLGLTKKRPILTYKFLDSAKAAQTQ